jgi:hypothetical protein
MFRSKRRPFAEREDTFPVPKFIALLTLVLAVQLGGGRYCSTFHGLTRYMYTVDHAYVVEISTRACSAGTGAYVKAY